jgi:hypothetical protein
MISEHEAVFDIDSLPAPQKAPGLGVAGLVLAGVGALLCLLALSSESARERLGYGWLWGFTFVWTVVLGSLFFVGLQHVTSSLWSVVVRRVAEMFAAPMWLIAIMFIGVLILGGLEGGGFFGWLNGKIDLSGHSAESKRIYLNYIFFVGRAVLFFGLWILFARYFVGRSLRQDNKIQVEEAASGMKRISAPFMVIFALTTTFASFDWLMSLDPMWYSTIYGVYVFAGMFVTALAVITLAVLGLRRTGRLGDGVVTPEHLYSLGGLLFGFSCFWAYIAFSQYMLIWYGNIPEEAVYFVRRLEGGWLRVSILLALLRFAVPFFLLLSQPAKMDARRLVLVSVLVVLGQLVDLYWLIMPYLHTDSPKLSWPEMGPVLLMSGVIIVYIARFMSRNHCLAVHDPRFEQSRRFHL